MIWISAVDNSMGLMFNHRRQSMDRLLRKRVLELAAGKKLWMNAYSARQFGDEGHDIITVDENFLSRAGSGDFVFCEDQPMRPWMDRIESVILYRWNRDYPGDMFLDFDASQWKLDKTEDFAGSSHEKITEEIWVK